MKISHQNFSSCIMIMSYTTTINPIKAFLLYPLNCSCKGLCGCEVTREQIVISLTIDLFNQVEERQVHPDQLQAMKLFLKIPNDSYFRATYAQSYPVWVMKEKFRQEEKNFKIVEQMVWGLLRLANTYELSVLKESRASIHEAVEMILGTTPLKSNKLGKKAYLCGEKAYSTQLVTYKSVCHIIAALTYLEARDRSFTLDQPDHIEKFLSLSHWFRKKLLALKTPNIKQKSLFSNDTLVPLPDWVSSDNIHIPLDPYEDKLQKINSQFQLAG